MKCFTKTVQSLNYSIAVSVEELQAIMRKDEVGMTNGETKLYDFLYALPQLRKIEYDAHFGPHISVEIYKEDDTAENWDKIFSIIASYIEG